MEKRKLGQTGQESSVIAFGSIALLAGTQADADRLVAEALELGVNHFDVAPSYGNGEAESRLGIALEGKRDSIFLACKTAERKRADARRELESSLKRLKTDHFDLYQLHAVSELDQVETALGPAGAMEEVLAAREKGLVRFIGISSHRPSVLLEAMRRFSFDTVMLPVNFVLHHKLGYEKAILEEAKRTGIGVIALKALADRPWNEGEERIYPHCWYRPLESEEDISLALRFSLSQPITTAVLPGDARIHRKAFRLAEGLTPLSSEESPRLQEMARARTPILQQV